MCALVPLRSALRLKNPHLSAGHISHILLHLSAFGGFAGNLLLLCLGLSRWFFKILAGASTPPSQTLQGPRTLTRRYIVRHLIGSSGLKYWEGF